MRLKIIKFKKKKKPGSRKLDIIVGYKIKGRSKNFLFAKLGFLNFKTPRILGINLMRLGYWLNHGAVLNKSVRKYLIKLIFLYYDKRTLL